MISGQGEGLGATHHNLVDRVREYADAIANATGTVWNTYAGHGNPGGSNEWHTADFWGAGGRGSPLSASQGMRTADLALERYNANPPVLYIIRQGEYWRGGNWQAWPQDPHRDHTHVSWDSPGGASASGGMGPNPKQERFERMWAATINPWGEKWVDRMSPASQFHRGSGTGTSNATHSIYDWIDAKIPDMIAGAGTSGSGELGGDPAKNRQLGEEMFNESGIPGSFNSLDSLWMKESGWDRFAENPSSGAYGIPQALPPTKLPAGGQKSGGSQAGPQIDWGLGYIQDRYGSTDKAWQHSQAQGWYTNGGIALKDQVARVGDNGPEFFMPLRDDGAAREFVRFLRQLVPKGFEDPDERDRYARGVDAREHVRTRAREAGVSDAVARRADNGIRDELRELRREFRDVQREANDILEDVVRSLRRIGIDEGTIEHIGRAMKNATDFNLAKDATTARQAVRGIARRAKREYLTGPRR
jgi:hypothetical protein